MNGASPIEGPRPHVTSVMGSLSLRVGVLGWVAAHLLELTALTAGASAQTHPTTGDLKGTVRDETQAVLPGVTIVAVQPTTALMRTTASAEDGTFVVPALPAGTYQLRAELSGFNVQVFEDIEITIGATVDVSITLALSGFADRITVVAATRALVDPERTAIAREITQRQIESLPINRRNFVSFALITPGVATDQTLAQGAASTSGLVFHGQRARSNNITIDGLDNNDITVGSVRATFSQEAVREFQVVTNSYGAEFGNASGGVVNIVTRNGTNLFQGSAFFYFRDRALNARNYFERYDVSGAPIEPPKAPYSQLQFGGIAGGPIKRDSTFFFLSFERLDVDNSNFVTIDDATQVADPNGGPALGTPAEIIRRAGFPIDSGHVPFTEYADAFLARLDHRFAAAETLIARVNYAGVANENADPWGGLIARSRGGAIESKDVAVASTYTRAPSSRMLNELRGQYAYRTQSVLALDPRCPMPCTLENQGGPTVGISGVGSFGRQQYTPQLRAPKQWQLSDTFTFFRGDHSLKAGVDVKYIDTPASLPLAFGGQYAFAALPRIPGLTPAPVTAIQAFALGVPAVYFQGYGNSDAGFLYKELSGFVQDDWHVGSALTVKAGLRYQLSVWPRLRFTPPDLEAYTLPRDYNDLAPRLAFALKPASSGSTVIRGAYGLFFERHPTTLAANAKSLDGVNGVRTFLANLPSMLPVTAWQSANRRLQEPSAPYSSLIQIVDSVLRSPYAHHASGGVDRQLPGQILASANVVWVRGVNQLGALEYNPIVPELGAGRRPLDVNGVAGTSSGVSQLTSYGTTWYRGLMLSLSTHAQRHQFLASYTLSSAEDNVTDYIGGPENNGRGRDPANPRGLPAGFDPSAERGPSVHDQRHRVVFSGIYEAPFGVQLSTIITAASGRPYTVSAGFDFNRDGSPTDRARRDPQSAPSDYSTSVRRNSERLPGGVVVDFRGLKRIRTAERVSVEVMIEAFNVFDRVVFSQINHFFGPGAYPSTPAEGFGQFTKADPPRQVQLGVRVVF